MNVECEGERGGTETGIPNDQIESRGGTTNKHVKDPRRGSRWHERGTDMLLGKIGRDSVGGMSVSGIDSGDIVETGDRSRVGDDRDGGDRSVITINIGRGDLQFNFIKKNGGILTNGLEESSPSTKIIMKDSGNVLVITESEGTDMTGLRNKAREGENGRSRSGNSGSERLRTLGRGANRNGHIRGDDDLGLDEVSLLVLRFRVKFKRQ